MAVLLLTAAALEQADLAAAMTAAVGLSVAGRTWRRGLLAGRDTLLVEGGIGAVNTAHALTRALEAEAFDLVLQVGVGGAYAGGAAVGDLAVATEEFYGDLGVITPQGWRPADLIGLPVARVQGAARTNRFPVDAILSARAVGVLRGALAGVGVHAGPFVTVQACSGTAALGRERAARAPGAVCESMEGAAAAHVCGLYGAPFVEVRGLSNLVEDRDLSRWDLAGASARAQVAALCLLPELAA